MKRELGANEDVCKFMNYKLVLDERLKNYSLEVDNISIFYDFVEF